MQGFERNKGKREDAGHLQKQDLCVILEHFLQEDEGNLQQIPDVQRYWYVFWLLVRHSGMANVSDVKHMALASSVHEHQHKQHTCAKLSLHI